MKNNKGIWIIVAVMVIAVGAIYFFVGDISNHWKEEEKEEVTELDSTDFELISKYEWMPTYIRYDEDPYGGSFIFNQLKRFDKDGDVDVINKSLRSSLYRMKKKENVLYFFVGQIMSTEFELFSDLAEFVDQGGNAFIACSDPYQLYDALNYVDERPEFAVAYYNVFPVVYSRDTTNLYYFFREDTVQHEFCFSPKESIDTFQIEVFARHNDHPIFYRIEYGLGNYYICTAPEIFANISLQDEKVLELAERILQELPESDIYWDEYSQLLKIDPPIEFEYEGGDGMNQQPDEGLLSRILKHPSLTWAWFIFLFGVLAFLIFKARRRQRIIPPIQENKNTTTGFIKVVSELYRSKGTHQHLTRQKRNHFYHYVHQRYGIHPKTAKNFKNQLIHRSGLSQEEIESLLNKIQSSDNKELSDKELYNLHNELENFYKNAR